MSLCSIYGVLLRNPRTDKLCDICSHGSVVKRMTRNHEIPGSIPGVSKSFLFLHFVLSILLFQKQRSHGLVWCPRFSVTEVFARPLNGTRPLIPVYNIGEPSGDIPPCAPPVYNIPHQITCYQIGFNWQKLEDIWIQRFSPIFRGSHCGFCAKNRIFNKCSSRGKTYYL